MLPLPQQLPADKPHSPAGRLVYLLYWYLLLQAEGWPQGDRQLLQAELLGPAAAWVRASDGALPPAATLLAARLLAGLTLAGDGHREYAYTPEQLARGLDLPTRELLRDYVLEPLWRPVAAQLLDYLRTAPAGQDQTSRD